MLRFRKEIAYVNEIFVLGFYKYSIQLKDWQLLELTSTKS